MATVTDIVRSQASVWVGDAMRASASNETITRARGMGGVDTDLSQVVLYLRECDVLREGEKGGTRGDMPGVVQHGRIPPSNVANPSRANSSNTVSLSDRRHDSDESQENEEGSDSRQSSLHCSFIGERLSCSVGRVLKRDEELGDCLSIACRLPAASSPTRCRSRM